MTTTHDSFIALISKQHDIVIDTITTYTDPDRIVATINGVYIRGRDNIFVIVLVNNDEYKFSKIGSWTMVTNSSYVLKKLRTAIPSREEDVYNLLLEYNKKKPKTKNIFITNLFKLPNELFSYIMNFVIHRSYKL
jgi:hypothetical protein